MTNELIQISDQARRIEEILDYAWHQAVKYRFDPVVGKIHEDYLEMVKKLKKELKS